MKEEQGRQQDSSIQISLRDVFSLDPETRKRLHPYAAERCYTWVAEVRQEIVQLTTENKVNIDVDIDTYLDDDDRTQVEKHKHDIQEWLDKCTDTGMGYSPHPYDTSITSDMSTRPSGAMMGIPLPTTAPNKTTKLLP